MPPSASGAPTIATANQMPGSTPARMRTRKKTSQMYSSVMATPQKRQIASVLSVSLPGGKQEVFPV